MDSELLKYSKPVTRSQLPAFLAAPTIGPSSPTGCVADLAAMGASMAHIMESTAPKGSIGRAAWDAPTARVLYEGLGRLPVSVAVDMRFWHWLCIEPFSRFVWQRWLGAVPDDPREAMTPALSERFLGTASLRGVSRNALARLYWTARTLRESTEDYSLVDQALGNQDFFQAIFERALGLYRPAAIACLNTLGGSSEDERRLALRRLNHYLTTIALEALDEDEISSYLREGVSPASLP